MHACSIKIPEVGGKENMYCFLREWSGVEWSGGKGGGNVVPVNAETLYDQTS